MSSTILYKFRSGTTFEALPLPGSAARLFDVKKAIVVAKKLDQGGGMEFDLSVRDATTNEEYTDETMLLPRGTRVVVQRLPAARGHGFLSRLARNPTATAPSANASSSLSSSHHHHHPQTVTSSHTVPTNFYTIDSRAQDEDEDFVSATAATTTTTTTTTSAEDQELAALRAATESLTTPTVAMSRGAAGAGGWRPPNFRSTGPAGQGPPGGGHPGQRSGMMPPAPHAAGGGGRGGGAGGGQYHQRPNADPELREQEKHLQPKKRATGIPRTFLNLSAPVNPTPAAGGTGEHAMGEGGEGGGGNVPLLQPNTIGFEELVHRGGGQSENASGTKRDLDYALKLTATSIPEYLQCPICHSVVKDAVILTWDPEGRTSCESCIRDALTQSGFRCPLTGQEGVSPDDLLPNLGLRKAAEQFIKGVMQKMEEIEQQKVDEGLDDDEMETSNADNHGTSKQLVQGDIVEKGVLVASSKRASISDRKKQHDDDPFGGGGGDDDFGGDVFAVEEKPMEAAPAAIDHVTPAATTASTETPTAGAPSPAAVSEDKSMPVDDDTAKENDHAVAPASKAADNDEEMKDAETKNPDNRSNGKSIGDHGGEVDRSSEKATKSNADAVDRISRRSRSRSPYVPREPQQQQQQQQQQHHHHHPHHHGHTDGSTDSVQGGSSRRDAKRRGPPIGYAMGPAGGAAVSARVVDEVPPPTIAAGNHPDPSPRSSSGSAGRQPEFHKSYYPGNAPYDHPSGGRPFYRGGGRGRGRYGGRFEEERSEVSRVSVSGSRNAVATCRDVMDAQVPHTPMLGYDCQTIQRFAVDDNDSRGRNKRARSNSEHGGGGDDYASSNIGNVPLAAVVPPPPPPQPGRGDRFAGRGGDFMGRGGGGGGRPDYRGGRGGGRGGFRGGGRAGEAGGGFRGGGRGGWDPEFRGGGGGRGGYRGGGGGFRGGRGRF